MRFRADQSEIALVGKNGVTNLRWLHQVSIPARMNTPERVDAGLVFDGAAGGEDIDLKGKIVIVDIWGTWCPPCRREMPDMEKLYQRFSQKGLVVLAVSDEKRETVEDFLKKQDYTFPVLLDPDRKVNTAFGIEGIPNSFLFDRQGKLAAQSIDMRTERQFLEMFKTAGLE